MDNITQTLNSAANLCIEQGARLTTKRKLVLAELLRSPIALSAYEIMERVNQLAAIRMPAMSVYRILTFLEEKELAHKLNTENKYVACTHILCDHAHKAPQFLICERCLSVKEESIDQETFNRLANNLKVNGFQLKQKQLEMKGLCNHCL